MMQKTGWLAAVLLALMASANLAAGQELGSRTLLDPQIDGIAAERENVLGSPTVSANEPDTPLSLQQAVEWTQREPGNADAWLALGNVHRRLDHPADAIAAYQHALQIDTKRVVAWVNLGMVYDQLKQPEKAIDAYRQGLRLDLDVSVAWYNLGNSLRDLGQHAKSVGAYRQVLRLDPQHANAWNNLGLALVALKQYQDAIAAYHEALRIEPRFAKAWAGLSLAQGAAGQQADMIVSYRKLRSLDAVLSDMVFDVLIDPP